MKLYLEDGTSFDGKDFGAAVDATGEVVFSTGMTGYVESLTDPSFAGQILVCTYPLIGNYGVPSFAKASEDKPLSTPFESEKIQVAGLVVSEYSEEFSHFDAKQSLSAWLKSSGVPGLTGVDTRAITKRLRERGVMLGALGKKNRPEFEDPNRENLVARVSPHDVRTYGTGPIRIIAVDCGMKENIIRSISRTETTVIRVPWNYDFTRDQYDAIVVGNGPGDPELCVPTIHHIRTAMRDGMPILGVCLGNQLLALAAGGATYKLKYGHRGQNQPCVDLLGGSGHARGACYITSQNHGFAVDAKSLPDSWSPWFTNANDGSVEGIRHATRPWRSVQFHPEACPGPVDTAWIFEDFLHEIRARRKLRVVTR